uniref:Uncharacterized protein n=1 Tax=Apteryx owenii TaxID=8824 RepID=A0A8B9S1V6_APTOW
MAPAKKGGEKESSTIAEVWWLRNIPSTFINISTERASRNEHQVLSRRSLKLHLNKAVGTKGWISKLLVPYHIKYNEGEDSLNKLYRLFIYVSVDSISFSMPVYAPGHSYLRVFL